MKENQFMSCANTFSRARKAEKMEHTMLTRTYMRALATLK